MVRSSSVLAGTHFKLHDGLEEFTALLCADVTGESLILTLSVICSCHTCFELTYNKASQSKEAEALVSNTMRPRWSRDLEAKQDRFTYRGEQEDRRSDRSSDRHERSFNRDSNRRRYDDRQAPSRDYRRGSSSNSFERNDERKFTRPSRSWGNRERTYTDRSGDEGAQLTLHLRAPNSRFGSERSNRNDRFDRGSRFGGERSDRGGRFNSRDGARSTASTHKPRVWGPSGVKDIKGSEE